MGTKNISVKKASGEMDIYSEEKLKRSLARSGVNEQLIQNIIKLITPRLYDGIPTKKIYQLAFQQLKKTSRENAGRYNLKRSIMSLGPSGFPFEQYIGSIFVWKGYHVKLKQFLDGVCVSHEIDVLAENDNHVLLIECKYHNSQGIFSDVKIPLYIHSRYLDVLGLWNKRTPKKPLQGWVVTNTKFSTDALKYGTCAGLNLLGWNYPGKNSLSNMVDESGLYPITCLVTLTKKEKEQIMHSGIVLSKDLLNKEELLRKMAINNIRIQKISTEIKELCKLF